MMKIHCAESGYFLEIDGVMSTAHRYGYSCITSGPSGTMYGAHLDREPEPSETPQLYRLTPTTSLVERDLADDGIEYEELPDEDEEDELDEGEDDEAEEEVEVEDEVESSDDEDEDEDKS